MSKTAFRQERISKSGRRKIEHAVRTGRVRLPLARWHAELRVLHYGKAGPGS